MNYYISDLHLFHKNVTGEGKRNFDNRPFKTVEEMHESILNNWNKTVSNADHVYILGDVAMRGNMDEVIAFVSQLRGNKHLIVGNHDNTKDQRYRQLFVENCNYKELTDSIDGKTYNLVLCHYPIMFWNHQHRGSVHLYGHVHNSVEETMYQGYLRQINDALRDRNEPMAIAKNVGCMMKYMDYTPRTLKEILGNVH